MTAFHIYLYGPQRGPLPCSFEDAQIALADEGFYCEADGSLGRGGMSPVPWQLVGTLYDAAGQLQYVELQGWCPESIWREVLKAIGIDAEDIQLFLPAAGEWITLENFVDRFGLASARTGRF